MDPCRFMEQSGIRAIVLLYFLGCTKKLTTLFSLTIQMQNIFVHPYIEFSFTFWEDSVNRILSEKEENSRTCIAQIKENNQMVLIML